MGHSRESPATVISAAAATGTVASRRDERVRPAIDGNARCGRLTQILRGFVQALQTIEFLTRERDSTIIATAHRAQHRGRRRYSGQVALGPAQ